MKEEEKEVDTLLDHGIPQRKDLKPVLGGRRQKTQTGQFKPNLASRVIPYPSVDIDRSGHHLFPTPVVSTLPYTSSHDIILSS